MIPEICNEIPGKVWNVISKAVIPTRKGGLGWKRDTWVEFHSKFSGEKRGRRWQGLADVIRPKLVEVALTSARGSSHLSWTDLLFATRFDSIRAMWISGVPVIGVGRNTIQPYGHVARYPYITTVPLTRDLMGWSVSCQAVGQTKRAAVENGQR